MNMKHRPTLPVISRRTLLQASTVGAAVPALAYAQASTPVASPIASPIVNPVASPAASPTPETVAMEWPSYGQDLSGDKAILDGVITSQNVTSLEPIWTVDVSGPVSATPIIAGGVSYVGSYDGSLYAIDIASGSVIWTYETGADVLEPNLEIPLGITGSAHESDGVVFVGDATATVHAIDAATGEAIWTQMVDDQEDASIWSSPVVWNGMVFVGVASIAKEVGFRGSVVALNADSGDLAWQTYMVPDGADGAGVFAVPAIDEARGMLFVATQNAYSENEAPYGNPTSVVALDAASGDIVWAFNAPPNDGGTAPTEDVAFSASPNLFTATIDGVERDLLGEGQKSGDFWVLDRETGDEVWTATVAPAGFLGGMEGTSAVANGVIAVPATDWPEFDGPAAGMVTGLDASTGDELWSQKQDAPAASPVGISNDVVFHAGMDGVLHAYGLNDGTELWTADLGASASGGVGIATGVVIVGAATPQFAEFVTPGNQIHAFGFIAEPATPAASPTAEQAASPPVEPTESPTVTVEPPTEPTMTPTEEPVASPVV
jgi:polyvinyl alcohol dehydrogenase (cytochrome)